MKYANGALGYEFIERLSKEDVSFDLFELGVSFLYRNDDVLSLIKNKSSL